jgi:hypothetical protein
MKHITGAEYKQLLGNINANFTGTALETYNIEHEITILELPMTDGAIEAYEKVAELNPDEHVMIWMPLGSGANIFDSAEDEVIFPIVESVPPTSAFALVVNLPTIEELIKFVTKTYNLKAFL